MNHKYQHPEEPTLTWSGIGRSPQWVAFWIDNGGSLEGLATAQVKPTANGVTVTTTEASIAQVQPSAKKRGRPASGQAQTAAERKRRSRERAQTVISESGDWSTVPLTALLERYGNALANGAPTMARLIALELVKRAESAGAPT